MSTSDPPSAPPSAPPPPPDDAMLTIRQLADLWDVTEQCIYNWRDAKRVNFSQDAHDQWLATKSAARAAKVLRESEVRRRLDKRQVRPASLQLAKRTGAVQPDAWPPKNEPRYSLDDVEAIARIDTEQTLDRQAAQEALVHVEPVPQDAVEVTPDAGPGPSGEPAADEAGRPTADGVEATPVAGPELGAEGPSSSAAPLERRDRHRAVLDYLERSLRPCDMPPWFWMGPSCPPFIAPAGVFRYEFSVTRFDRQTKSYATAVRRSAGHTLIHGKPKFVPADASWQWLRGLHRVGACPRGLELTNQAYDLALEEWWTEYRRHGGPMALLDFGTGDREAAVRRYVASEQSPADLPAWFWDTEQMPAFVPPFETFYVTCGEQFVDEDSGETMTWLTRSDGWEETWLTDDDAPKLQPRPRIERMFPVEGAYAPGTVPEQFVAGNWRYLVAKEAWEAQWHRHRRLREAAIAAVTKANKSG